jgi:Tol biopolymer transport system component
LSADRQEVEHLYPHFLPDGRRFLYFAGSLDDRHTGVYMASLDGGEPRLVASMQSRAEYANGYLIFGRGRDLFAQRFDLDTLTLAGQPVRLGEPVGTSFGSMQNYAFTTAGARAVAFLPGPRVRSQLVQVSSVGEVVRSLGGPDAWISMAISPDGTRLALERLDEDGKSVDVWMMDLTTQAISRFTTFSGPWRWFGTPVWSHDSTRLLVSNFTGPYWLKLTRRPGDLGERLPHKLDGNGGWPTDWSADRKFVVAGQNDPVTSQDIWVLPTEPGGQPVLYANTRFSEHGGHLSPDGRWLAWTSNESGQNEIYVDSFPTPSSKALVSRGGGAHPRWRRDGKALYYIARGEMLTSAEISTNGDQDQDRHTRTEIPRAWRNSRSDKSLGV